MKCPACLRQGAALKKLWLQNPNRPDRTEFNWRCDICGKNRRLTVRAQLKPAIADSPVTKTQTIDEPADDVIHEYVTKKLPK
jgi:hypothetical protein